MEILSFRDKLGYASAAIGEGAPYMLVCTFMMFFLTTVVKMDPIIVGFISSLATVMNVVANPMVGYISDNTNSRWGKRRPYIFLSLFPLAISLLMLFTAIGGSTAFQAIYYGLFLIIFWVAYAVFYDCWLALGGDYAKDYNDRTSIRTYSSALNTIGCVLGQVLPTSMVAFLYGLGVAESHAWQLIALVVALTTFFSVWICIAAAKNIDSYDPAFHSDLSLDNIWSILQDMFLQYTEVLKIKPVLYVMLASLIYLVGYGIITTVKLYYLTYNLGMSGTSISLILFLALVIDLGVLPVSSFISMHFGKRTALISMLSISAVLTIGCKFYVIHTFCEVFMLFLFICLGSQCYWQLIIAIEYDACDYDEMVTGKKRSGTILSMQSALEAIGPGIGSVILGIILHFAGFNGETAAQNATTLEWIENSMLILPAALMLAAGFMIVKFPITKEKHQEIRAVLEERSRPV
jgi:glycoside/pentoside/hexuronide:cation symporter, GPH family